MKKLTCILIIAMLILCGCQDNTVNDNGISDDWYDVNIVSDEDISDEKEYTDESTLTDRRPMICVDDTLYYISNKTVSELPESATLIGSIESTVSQSEIPTEQFSSNDVSAPIGSLIYSGENSDIIYIEISDSANTVYLEYIADNTVEAE